MKLVLAVALYLTFIASAYAAITDIKFGQYQIADSQWNVSACLNTATCEIYRKNPGTAYKIPWTSGQVQWAAGDYVQFELSGNSSFPYIAKQYTSSGTLKTTLGTGKIVNMGPDYFFFVGNDNDTGQLFSGSSGMSDTSGVTWTGTLNPTLAEADAYADNNYSTTPLAPGETASASPPPPPDPVYSSGITPQQASIRAAAVVGIQGHELTATITGDNNLVSIEQIGDGHYLLSTITGNNNTVDITQTSTVSGVHHYLNADLIGNNNVLDILQEGANKTAFISVNGDYTDTEIVQTGLGEHYLSLDILGNDHVTVITQQGSGNHNATIQLDGTQPWTFTLEQNSNQSHTYSLPHALTDNSVVSGTCNTIGGCNISITQE